MSEPRDAPLPPNQPGRLERAGHAFARNPLYQGLTDISGAAIGLLAEGVAPGASTVVPAATTGLRVATLAILGLYRKRADTLNAEVASVATVLPEDVLRREDFLHCYLATLQATIHTRREEKIRLFARLLVSTIEDADLAGVDEYEELLGVLVEMSDREIRILTILERFETTAMKGLDEAGQEEDDYHLARRFWPDFTSEVVRTVTVPADEVEHVVTRLARTGLYATFRDRYGGSGGRGHLTPRYYRLRQLIEDRDGNVIAPDVSDTDS